MARIKAAACHISTISVKRQRAGSGDTRIELAQRTGGGIARIGENLFTLLGLPVVHAREIGPQHQHFATHLERGGNMPTVQTQRYGSNRAQIRGDILAGRAVAACGPRHQ